MNALTIFIVCCLPATGQQTENQILTHADELPPHKLTTQDWVTEARSFAEGIYYKIPSEVLYREDIQAPDTILVELFARKVPVLEAWFKPGASSCAPPGSDIAMQVIVTPVFVIRIRGVKEEAPLREQSFVPTTEPSVGDCAYRVRHYDFTRQTDAPG